MRVQMPGHTDLAQPRSLWASGTKARSALEARQTPRCAADLTKPHRVYRVELDGVDDIRSYCG
jgi:hypothetical protein